MKDEALNTKRKMYDWLVRMNTEWPDHLINQQSLVKAFEKTCKFAREYVDELVGDGYAKRDGNRIAAVIGDDRPDIKEWLKKSK